MPVTERPGWQTSEFLLAALTILAATVLVVADQLDATAWTVTVTGAVAAYNASRAVAKSGATRQARTEAYLEHAAAVELRAGLERDVTVAPTGGGATPAAADTPGPRRPRSR